MHHDGPLVAMGPVLGDMCRSWVGWAAVAAVGLDPLAGDDVSGRWKPASVLLYLSDGW